MGLDGGVAFVIDGATAGYMRIQVLNDGTFDVAGAADLRFEAVEGDAEHFHTSTAADGEGTITHGTCVYLYVAGTGNVAIEGAADGNFGQLYGTGTTDNQYEVLRLKFIDPVDVSRTTDGQRLIQWSTDLNNDLIVRTDVLPIVEFYSQLTIGDGCLNDVEYVLLGIDGEFIIGFLGYGQQGWQAEEYFGEVADGACLCYYGAFAMYLFLTGGKRDGQ